MGTHVWLGMVVLVSSISWGTHAWAGHSEYQAKIYISGRACDTERRNELIRSSEAACKCIHRAAYLIEHHYNGVKKMFPAQPGGNFAALYRDKAIFAKRLGNRYRACKSGQLKYSCVGRCGTEMEREAYTMVYFGRWPGSTVNICDEFFESNAAHRDETIAHEYGRLEGFGDSENFDSDNVYVWDTIVRSLCSDMAYPAISQSDS